MMLVKLGEKQAAKRIEDALFAVFQDGKVRTRDLGGAATSSEFTEAVLRHLESSTD